MKSSFCGLSVLMPVSGQLSPPPNILYSSPIFFVCLFSLFHWPFTSEALGGFVAQYFEATEAGKTSFRSIFICVFADLVSLLHKEVEEWESSDVITKVSQQIRVLCLVVQKNPTFLVSINVTLISSCGWMEIYTIYVLLSWEGCTSCFFTSLAARNKKALKGLYS